MERKISCTATGASIQQSSIPSASTPVGAGQDYREAQNERTLGHSRLQEWQVSGRRPKSFQAQKRRHL
jgi:hypothetical protein